MGAHAPEDVHGDRACERDALTGKVKGGIHLQKDSEDGERREAHHCGCLNDRGETRGRIRGR